MFQQYVCPMSHRLCAINLPEKKHKVNKRNKSEISEFPRGFYNFLLYVTWTMSVLYVDCPTVYIFWSKVKKLHARKIFITIWKLL